MRICVFFKRIVASFLVVWFFSYSYALGVSYDSFVWDDNDITSSVSTTPTTNTSNSLNLECGGAVLIEQNSGKVLYDHNMHEKLRPASVTKVMTILLIMEALDSRKNYS